MDGWANRRIHTPSPNERADNPHRPVLILGDRKLQRAHCCSSPERKQSRLILLAVQMPSHSATIRVFDRNRPAASRRMVMLSGREVTYERKRTIGVQEFVKHQASCTIAGTILCAVPYKHLIQVGQRHVGGRRSAMRCWRHERCSNYSSNAWCACVLRIPDGGKRLLFFIAVSGSAAMAYSRDMS